MVIGLLQEIFQVRAAKYQDITLMDNAQAVMTEIFGPLDLGLMDKIFDSYD